MAAWLAASWLATVWPAAVWAAASEAELDVDALSDEALAALALEAEVALAEVDAVAPPWSVLAEVVAEEALEPDVAVAGAGCGGCALVNAACKVA